MNILSFPFFQNALVGVVIISVASALIGCYIMSRRMVFISGGITHACFGGLGLGYFLGVSPVAMAAVFAVAGSLGVDWMSRGRARRDSAIAVVWAFGMALGILFMFLTPGSVPELNSFLFGSVLTITRADLWIFAGFTAALMVFYAIFYRVIVAVSLRRGFRAYDPSAGHVCQRGDDSFRISRHSLDHQDDRCHAPHVARVAAADDVRACIRASDASVAVRVSAGVCRRPLYRLFHISPGLGGDSVAAGDVLRSFVRHPLAAPAP